MAVTFAGVAVTRGAFVVIKRADRLQESVGICQRTPDEFGLFGDGPRAILPDCPDNSRDDNNKEEPEKRFACFEALRRGGSHDRSRNLRISAMGVKHGWHACSHNSHAGPAGCPEFMTTRAMSARAVRR